MAVEAASAAPCQANSLISVRTRRCDSMANAISSRNAASRLTNWLASDMRQPLTRKWISMPSTPSRNAVDRNSGARNRRSLASSVSSSASPAPATASLAGSARERDRQHRPVAGFGDAPGHEERESDGHVGEQLDRHRPLDQREVARRILQDHRLVHHGELEVRARVVDRDARVLGEQHHEEGHRGEGEARVDREFAVRERVDDGGELGRAADERGGEQGHQHRRLGEEADQHLAPRAQPAEGGADVHRGERREHARQREHADQRDDVRRRREREVRWRAPARSRRRATCSRTGCTASSGTGATRRARSTASLWNSFASV